MGIYFNDFTIYGSIFLLLMGWGYWFYQKRRKETWERAVNESSP